jgi:CheY-like chemotaxis protein
MPNMSGDDATAAVREMGVTVPIVGLTGDAHREDTDAFQAKGANEVGGAHTCVRG